LLSHAGIGVTCLLGAFWVLVESSRGEGFSSVGQGAAWLCAFAAWGALLFGGFLYITAYPETKPVILAGPWPWAHKIVMETKEHVFFGLLGCASLLPFATRHSGGKRAAGRLAAVVVVLGLAMEGMGAVIALAARVALEAAP